MDESLSYAVSELQQAAETLLMVPIVKYMSLDVCSSSEGSDGEKNVAEHVVSSLISIASLIS